MTPPIDRRSFLGGIAAGTALQLQGCASGNGKADLIITNARIHTMDPARPTAQAVAVAGGRFTAVGTDVEVSRLRAGNTRMIDASGRAVIPGLIDSHQHFVRGSQSYDLDVRWDGVGSIAEAMALLTRQAARTPPGQWVRVGGGWSEFQFAEKRMPTLAELNAAVPHRPAFVLHFYNSSMLNRAGLEALGMGREFKAPEGGIVERDAGGTPTGMLVAHPLPAVILAPEARMPSLAGAAAENSVARFARELNRLGLTSVIDPGGAGQVYPDAYAPHVALAKRNALTVRLGMFIVPQRAGNEVEDFGVLTRSLNVRGDEHRFRFIGGGEMVLQPMQDWDLYTTPQVIVPHGVEPRLQQAVKVLADAGWYIRQHSTFDATANLYMDAIEAVAATAPMARTRWILDHAELVTDATLERVKRLGGGISIQHRAAFHGELGVRNYGAARLAEAPPIRRMLGLGIPVGIGTDATRDTTYNPWVCIKWLVTGRTVGGTKLRADDDLVDVATAIRLYTMGSAWMSGEEDAKGSIAPGKLADLAILSQDPMSVQADSLDTTEAVLTVMDGSIVHAAGAFAALAPPPVPAAAAWSPHGPESPQGQR